MEEEDIRGDEDGVSKMVLATFLVDLLGDDVEDESEELDVEFLLRNRNKEPAVVLMCLPAILLASPKFSHP